MSKEDNNNVSSDISDLKKSMLEINNKIKKLEKKESNTKIEYDDPVNVNEENNENLTGRIYTLEKIIGNEKHIYQYKFHRKVGTNIDLRCRDYKCKGTAQINSSGEIFEKTKCSLEYSSHSYTKKIEAKAKIEKNEQTLDNMKDIIFQEQYFQYYLTKFPLITYDEILKLFIQTYPKVEIKFTNKQYHNLKAKIKSDQINVNNDIDIIDNLQFLETKMLKTYIKFLNENNEYSEIRVFGTEETFSYLSNKEIKQYFIDGTYKVLPNIENIKVLVLIIGNRGYTNDNVLCCSVLMSDEREETFKRLLNELKVYFDFYPEFITTDFSMSNINAIEKVFKDDNLKLITCFFHLVQAWWRKANQLGLRRNEIKEKTKFLINNLKLCAFMSFEEATKYYNMIKNHNDLKDERFELFFKYLDTTWFGFEEKKEIKLYTNQENILLSYGIIMTN